MTFAGLAWCEQQLNRMARLFAAMGGIAIFCLMGINIVAIFSRYILNDPIFGVEDLLAVNLTVFVATAIVFGGASQSNISINVIKFFAKGTSLRLTDFVAQSLELLIVGYVTYSLFSIGSCGFACGAITSNLSIVHTPFYYLLATAMGFYWLVILINLLNNLNSRTGRFSNNFTE